VGVNCPSRRAGWRARP